MKYKCKKCGSIQYVKLSLTSRSALNKAKYSYSRGISAGTNRAIKIIDQLKERRPIDMGHLFGTRSEPIIDAENLKKMIRDYREEKGLARC